MECVVYTMSDDFYVKNNFEQENVVVKDSYKWNG